MKYFIYLSIRPSGSMCTTMKPVVGTSLSLFLAMMMPSSLHLSSSLAILIILYSFGLVADSFELPAVDDVMDELSSSSSATATSMTGNFLPALPDLGSGF